MKIYLNYYWIQIHQSAGLNLIVEVQVQLKSAQTWTELDHGQSSLDCDGSSDGTYSPNVKWFGGTGSSAWGRMSGVEESDGVFRGVGYSEAVTPVERYPRWCMDDFFFYLIKWLGHKYPSERFRKNGLDPHRTSGEKGNGTNQKRAEKDKKERIFWKKGQQNIINRACTYLEKKKQVSPSSQSAVSKNLSNSRKKFSQDKIRKDRFYK